MYFFRQSSFFVGNLLSASLRFSMIAVIAFALLAPLAAGAGDYDLVILNGRVMDPESGLDEVRNVGVKDGKITAVTRDAIKGRDTIDASGHVVAPGFNRHPQPQRADPPGPENGTAGWCHDTPANWRWACFR